MRDTVVATLSICLVGLCLFAITSSARGADGAKPKVCPRELVQADRVLIIGHRGASAYAPENTIAAFKLAVAQKADLVEDDFHVTKDGKLIAIHDGTLDRTTNACDKWDGKRILVKSKTLAELRRLDAGSWKDAKFAGERLPTNNEAALEILKGSVPLLERKSGSPEQTVAELKDIGVLDKVVVQAFDWGYLRTLHLLEPKVVLGALGHGEITPAKIKVMKRAGASVVGWDHGHLTAESIKAIQQAGMRVWAYTVDDPDEMQRLVRAGINGIISNKPDLARKTVEAMAK